MTEQLKPLPCPFCGHTGLSFEDGSTHRWGLASCNWCGATTREVRRNYPDDGKWHAEAVKEWNRRAQPAQAVPASCGECGKKASDGWALYCVACIEEAGLPAVTDSPPLTHSCTSSLVRTADFTAQAGQVMSDDELRELEKKFNAERVRTSDEEYLVIYPSDYYDWQRAIEQAVRAKLWVSVPMTPQDHAAALDEAVDDGSVDEVDMWAFINGIKAAEKFHGIVGKEGA